MQIGYFNCSILRSILLLFSFIILIGCDDENVDNVSPTITKNPEIVLNPNNTTPLAALLTLETDEPTRVSVQMDSFDNGSAKTTIIENGDSVQINFDSFGNSHSLPLLGLSSDKVHSFEITVFDRAGNETISENILFVETDPLPEIFPPIKVTSIPALMEPGITLLHVGGRGANVVERYIIAVDQNGNVVWYFRPEGGVSDVRRLKNGNLLFIQDRTILFEIDMLGNIINQWHAALTTTTTASSIPLDANSLHHEVFEMENGNFLSLDVELREIENYPTSDTDPNAPKETATVAGDVVIEFTRDGLIVNRYSFFDIIDPLRIGYLSLIGFWDVLFPAEVQGTKDWSHGNAVIHDPSDDSYIVSLRHQDAVIKISRSTGQLIWILGTHDNWAPVEYGQFLLTPVGEEFSFQYHQHAPMITSEGNILLFDNGNFRASPFDMRMNAVDNFSRAVEYSINEETMEVEQVWEYGEFIADPIYSAFLSDADQMPLTGNVLITFGGITKDGSDTPTDNIGGAKVSVRIIEVTRASSPEVVFDLSIIDESENVADGWQTYRSERLPGLYP